jgi:hypothetical protein
MNWGLRFVASRKLGTDQVFLETVRRLTLGPARRELCRRRLAWGGIKTQFVQATETLNEVLDAVAATLDDAMDL